MGIVETSPYQQASIQSVNAINDRTGDSHSKQLLEILQNLIDIACIACYTKRIH